MSINIKKKLSRRLRPGCQHSVELSRGNDCADGLGCANAHAISMPTAKLVPTVAVGIG
jgi:hypothetical protein